MKERLTPAEWIVRNRQPRRSMIPVGELLPSEIRGSEARAAIRDAIASVVDEDFRACCSLGVIDAKGVEIFVRSPAECDWARLNWSVLLLEHLGRSCREFGGRRLVFKVGQSDDRFVVE